MVLKLALPKFQRERYEVIKWSDFLQKRRVS